MADAPDPATFVRLLTGCQSRLYAYVVTLLGGSADAADVLQETNAVLWAKAAEYDPARPFIAWAYGFTHMQVLAHRKRLSRDRLLFDDEILGHVAAEYARQDSADGQLEALELCLAKLSAEHRRLIRERYADGRSVNAIAAESGTDPNAVSAVLYRIRKALADCIRGQLAAGGSS